MNRSHHGGADEYADVKRAAMRHLVGMNHVEADRALDDARRLLWQSVFSGEPPEAVNAVVSPSPAAAAIATILSGAPLVVGDRLIYDLRLAVWSTRFAADPFTLFGRLFKNRALPPVPTNPSTGRLN